VANWGCDCIGRSLHNMVEHFGSMLGLMDISDLVRERWGSLGRHDAWDDI